MHFRKFPEINCFSSNLTPLFVISISLIIYTFTRAYILLHLLLSFYLIWFGLVWFCSLLSIIARLFQIVSDIFNTNKYRTEIFEIFANVMSLRNWFCISSHHLFAFLRWILVPLIVLTFTFFIHFFLFFTSFRWMCLITKIFHEISLCFYWMKNVLYVVEEREKTIMNAEEIESIRWNLVFISSIYI